MVDPRFAAPVVVPIALAADGASTGSALSADSDDHRECVGAHGETDA